MTRSLTPCHDKELVYFFCSSAKGPHGHDDEELMFFCSNAIGQSRTRRQAIRLLIVVFFFFVLVL